MFQSKSHENRFNGRLEWFEESYGAIHTDKFFNAMFYLLNSDFLNSKFEQLIEEHDDDNLSIDVDKLSSIDLSSTQRFMMTFALSFYFNVECDYNFAYSFYQLDRDNQELITNALSFLKH